MSILNTSQLRAAWAPGCKAKGSAFIAAYRALDAVLKRHGYAPRAADTGAYNCRAITGGTGLSLHAFGPGDRFTFWNGLTIATALAVDINWRSNPYGPTLVTDMPRAMTNEIKAIRTVNGKQVWGWGGDYRTNKDAMHFEIVCRPADLATGIAGTGGGSASRPTIRRGSKGAAVREWQSLLNTIAGRGLRVDGDFGPLTDKATRDFQRMFGLGVDGIVGPKTWGLGLYFLALRR